MRAAGSGRAEPGVTRPSAPAPRSPSGLVVATLVAVAVAWGLSFVVIKDAVADVSPASVVGWRFGIAAAALALLRPRTLVLVDRATVGRGIVLGSLLGSGFLLCAHGMRTTSVVASAFIVGTTVVFTPVVARLWLRRRLTRRARVAAALALAGLALLTLRGTSVGGGAVLIMAAAVLWAVHLCGLSRWARPDRVYASALVQLAAAALLAFLVGAATGTGSGLPGPGTLVQLLYLGAIATAAAFVALTWAQTRIDATTTAILLTLEPVVGAVAAVVLGEPLTAWAVLGALAVLAAGGLAVTGPVGVAIGPTTADSTGADSTRADSTRADSATADSTVAQDGPRVLPRSRPTGQVDAPVAPVDVAPVEIGPVDDAPVGNDVGGRSAA